MKLESWRGLVIFFGVSMIASAIAGTLLCNIENCSSTRIAGMIMEPLWILSGIAWFYIRAKKEKEE